MLCTRLIEANDEAARNRGGCNSFADAHRIFVCPSSINHLNHPRMHIYICNTRKPQNELTAHIYLLFSLHHFHFVFVQFFTDFYRKCLARRIRYIASYLRALYSFRIYHFIFVSSFYSVMFHR